MKQLSILELVNELKYRITILTEENQRLVKYADELVRHSNMPCLPADIRNLRDANLKFAVENEDLKKEIERLNEELNAIY